MGAGWQEEAGFYRQEMVQFDWGTSFRGKAENVPQKIESERFIQFSTSYQVAFCDSLLCGYEKVFKVYIDIYIKMAYTIMDG